jgi:hypothetical protein
LVFAAGDSDGFEDADEVVPGSKTSVSLEIANIGERERDGTYETSPLLDH